MRNPKRSRKVPRRRKRELSHITSIPLVDSLGNYLGFPLVNGRTNKSHYNSVVERIQNRLASWKGRLLNKAGKLCLVKSVTSSMPVYTMQTHCMPVSVCNKIDAISRNFFWGKGDQHRGWHLINWEVLTTPKTLGGLGIGDRRLTNMALLGKLVWSLLHERDKLWVQVLTHKYVKGTIWNTNSRGSSSIIWRSIHKAIEALGDGFIMRLNSGNTSFWYSDWTGMGNLCDLVDYVNISDTQLTLNQLWDNGDWALHRIATHLPDDVQRAIYDIHIPPHTNAELQDCWAWNGDQRGVYTASSGYKWLLNNTRVLPQNQDWRWIWKTCAPEKVQLLLWMIAHEILPTNELRFKRGIAQHAECQRCSTNCEGTLHLLRDCPHSREVWYRSGLRPARSFFTRTIVKEWIREHIKGRGECIFLAGIWWLWCWRNNMVLGDASWDVHQVLRRVFTSAQEYSQYLNPRKTMDLSGLPSSSLEVPTYWSPKAQCRWELQCNIQPDVHRRHYA